MQPWIFILLVPVCRVLINLDGWRYLSKAKRKHHEYIMGIPNRASSEVKTKAKAAANWLTSNLTEIKRKVKAAGVQNPKRSYMEAAGYGFAVQQSMTALDNILFHNEEVLLSASHTLSLAAGSYKTRAIQSVNPLYWLEVLFFLPKQIVSASGIDVSSKVADITLKVVQIIYWVAVVAALVLNPGVFKALFVRV